MKDFCGSSLISVNPRSLNLADALETWDEENLTRFIRAVCHLAEIRNPVMHALIDDENCDGIPL